MLAMKHISEYRDPYLASKLLDKIHNQADDFWSAVYIMEVCGTHTHSIASFGLKTALPENIWLVSGPGCPVCVTSINDVDRALSLAEQPGVIMATFGDMLKVPGSGGRSLEKLRAKGADVRIVSSAMECLDMAKNSSDKEVVFMGIGFETTAPTVAATVLHARHQNLKNFYVFSVHKLIPPALHQLLNDPDLRIDAFLCPGHVSVITGSRAYWEVIEAGRAAVIAGFEPIDILEAISMILDQLKSGKVYVENQYNRGVRLEGNPKARDLLNRVFVPVQAEWRGLGEIPDSGLKLRNEFLDFDASNRFDLPEISSQESKGCLCGEILKGLISPPDCPLFGKDCTPLNPCGPGMVSSEGACAAYYKYHSSGR